MAALLSVGGEIYAAEKAPQKLVDLANSEMVKLGSDSKIVKAVKAQNAKGLTMDHIMAVNKKWENLKDYETYVLHIKYTDLSNKKYKIIFLSKLLKKSMDKKVN